MHRAHPVFATRLRMVVNAVVTLGLAYGLYRHLFVDADAAALLDGFRQNFTRRPHWSALALTVALMPVNLWLEALKLRQGQPPGSRPAWGKAWRQICGGIAVGLWTPGRVGELGGRLVETAHTRERAAVLASTILGGAAQWVPLLLGGGWAVLRWRSEFAEPSTGDGADGLALSLVRVLGAPWVAWAAWGAMAVAGLVCVGFWRKPQLVDWLTHRTWVPQRLHATLEGLSAADGAGLLVASGARYLVYLLQMSLALRCFGLGLGLEVLLTGTAALFLLHGFLPLPPALQALARVELARVVFAFAKPNDLVILAASGFIFVLNLLLPALAGWWFIVRPHAETSQTVTNPLPVVDRLGGPRRGSLGESGDQS